MKKISEADTHKHIDLEELLIIMTVAGGNDSLPSQFMNIITLAEIAVKKAEKKHPKLVTQGWRDLESITMNSTLDRRAINLLRYRKNKEALLPILYFNLLAEIRRLRDITMYAAHLTEEPATPFNLKEFLETRLTPTAWPNMAMLNAITPCIFSIFMLATRLIGNIDNRTAVTDLVTVATRTQNGGHASNYGKDVLLRYFSGIMKDFPNEEKWTSLSAMFKEKFNLFEDKLIAFQASRSLSSENKPVTAGSNLKPDGLYNAFRNWARKDDDFLEALRERVPSFRK